MPLSEQQLGALEALEWVLNPEIRASGRSLTLAIAGIRVACRRPGLTVLIADHPHQGRGGEIIHRIVRDLVRTDHLLAPRANIQLVAHHSVSVVFDLPNPILDWLPNELALGSQHAAELGHLSTARAMIRPRGIPMIVVDSIRPSRPEDPEPKSRWDLLLEED